MIDLPYLIVLIFIHLLTLLVSFINVESLEFVLGFLCVQLIFENSLWFCLGFMFFFSLSMSSKVCISPLILKESIAGYSKFPVNFFYCKQMGYILFLFLYMKQRHTICVIIHLQTVIVFHSFCYFSFPPTPPTSLFPLYSPSFLHSVSLLIHQLKDIRLVPQSGYCELSCCEH